MASSSSTASIKVIGLTASTCTRKVLTILEELKIAYTFQAVDHANRENKSPEYLAKQQPFGQVPSFWDGDFHLYESRAIIRYLAHKYDANHTLLPTDHKLYGQVEQWISVEMSNYRVDDIVGELYIKKVYYGGGDPDQPKVDAAWKKVTRVLEVLEEHLSSKSSSLQDKNKLFLVGDHFTVADIVYMPMTHYFLFLQEYSNAFDKYPHVKTWWQNITSRPSWQKVISL